MKQKKVVIGKIKAKELSLIGKVIGTLFVIAAFIVKIVGQLEISTWDIIQVGLFIFVIYAPIDISKILEKFGRR